MKEHAYTVCWKASSSKDSKFGFAPVLDGMGVYFNFAF